MILAPTGQGIARRSEEPFHAADPSGNHSPVKLRINGLRRAGAWKKGLAGARLRVAAPPVRGQRSPIRCPNEASAHDLPVAVPKCPPRPKPPDCRLGWVRWLHDGYPVFGTDIIEASARAYLNAVNRSLGNGRSRNRKPAQP